MGNGISTPYLGTNPYYGWQGIISPKPLPKVGGEIYFNGKEDDQKSDGIGAGTVIMGAGLAVGAFFLGKNWKVVKNWASKLFNGKTAKTALEKAKTKEWFATTNKKHSIKGTSVTGAAKPITNAQEARVIQNIETKNANAASRRLVEQHMDDVVTPQMQAAYDRSIAYQPLTQSQKQAKAVREAQNVAQRAELNTVANTAKGGEALASVKTSAQKAENVAKTICDGPHLNPATQNTYYTQKGKVVKIKTAKPNSKGEEFITDPVKIAKHLAKHNVNLETFAIPQQLSVVA